MGVRVPMRRIARAKAGMPGHGIHTVTPTPTEASGRPSQARTMAPRAPGWVKPGTAPILAYTGSCLQRVSTYPWPDTSVVRYLAITKLFACGWTRHYHISHLAAGGFNSTGDTLDSGQLLQCLPIAGCHQ